MDAASAMTLMELSRSIVLEGILVLVLGGAVLIASRCGAALALGSPLTCSEGYALAFAIGFDSSSCFCPFEDTDSNSGADTDSEVTNCVAKV